MKPSPEADERIDQLVRAHLDREAAKVDLEKIVAGAKARGAVPVVPAAPRGPWRLVRWAAGVAVVAAALIIGISMIPPREIAQANPETVILEAQQKLTDNRDRCYDIETEWQGDLPKRLPILAGQTKATLWTRGDRFVIETTLLEGKKSHWGRNEAGQTWIALGPRIGLLFNPDEVSDWIYVASEMASMKTDSLLTEILRGFDLKYLPSENANRYLIHATPKAGRPQGGVKEATIEIDKETKVIEKLVLNRRLRAAGNLFEAKVTYTHTYDDTLPDSRYELNGYLEKMAKIVGPKDIKERSEWLQRFIPKRPIEKAKKD